MAIFRGALPADDFAIVANHWFRDPRLTGKAKGYMGYIATHSPKYRLTVEQLIAEMKESKHAVYAGLNELVEHGYLTRVQGNENDGTFGDVDYHFGPAAYTQQYVRAWAGSKRKGAKGVDQAAPESPDEDVSAGQAASQKPESGPDQAEQDVSAGQTASRFSASGKPASGKPDPKKTNSLKDQGLEEKEKTPPTPSDVDSAGDDSAEARDGGDSLDDETRDKLNAAVEGAAAERKRAAGWSLAACRRAVRDALEVGHPVDLVASSLMVIAADHRGTGSPNRLVHYLAAQARKSADSDVPEWAQASVTYLEPGRDRCERHRDYPADNCAQCRIDDVIAEREAAEEAGEPAPPMPGQDGRAAYLAVRAQLAAQRGAGAQAVEAGRVHVERGAGDVDRAQVLEQLEQLAAREGTPIASHAAA